MKLFMLVFFPFLFLGCLKDNAINKEDKSKINLKEDILQKKKVVISGKVDDPFTLKYVNLTNYSYFAGKDHEFIRKKFYGDSLYFVLDSISKPQLMGFYTFSQTIAYQAKILVTPGDTISFEIKNEKLTFNGKNKIQNNFYLDLDASTPDFSKNPYRGDIYAYKKSVKSIYNKKLAFLDQYIIKHKTLSEDFINEVKLDLKHNYIGTLLSPRITKVEGYDFYYSEPLITIVQKEFGTNEKLFDFNEYFDNLTIDGFKKSGNLNNSFFKNNINLFVRNYFDTSGYDDYSKEKFLAEKEFIEKNFVGEIRDYAIARMLVDYNKNGFGYSTDNIKFMETLIDDYRSTFAKQDYKEKMDEIKADLHAFDFKISDAALNTKLLSTIGDTLTLKEIFDRSSKRIRVIDFWASWCPPCIYEIKQAKDFKDKLSIESNVEWIYLSIDEDQEKWLQKSQELKEFLNVRNQYLILGGKNTSLGRSLQVNWIPRYIILNKQKNIVLNNAPRPSDSIIFKEIIDHINSNKVLE